MPYCNNRSLQLEWSDPLKIEWLSIATESFLLGEHNIGVSFLSQAYNTTLELCIFMRDFIRYMKYYIFLMSLNWGGGVGGGGGVCFFAFVLFFKMKLEFWFFKWAFRNSNRKKKGRSVEKFFHVAFADFIPSYKTHLFKCWRTAY